MSKEFGSQENAKKVIISEKLEISTKILWLSFWPFFVIYELYNTTAKLYMGTENKSP